MHAVPALAALLFAGLSAVPAAASPTYYLFDGDASRAYELTTTGTVVRSFTTSGLAYPAAVRDSIWLGHRDDAGAREYTLAGVATGATSAGGRGFSQLLDGATGSNGLNYGVECCGAVNSVTVANADWSGQRTLFNLVGNAAGAGIAFDGSDNTLFVSSFDRRITHYGLDGAVLGAFDLGQFLVGLAYDESTSSFWGFNRSTRNLVQFNRAGTVLADVDFGNFAPSNPFGGEMAVLGVAPAAVPEPGMLALTAAALMGLVLTRRRARG